MKCSDDAKTLKDFVERDKIFYFLPRLNVKFDQVQVQILGKEKLPSLAKIFLIIQSKESRRFVMLEPHQLRNQP